MANTLGSPTLGFQSFGLAEGNSPTAGMTPVWIASTDTGLMFRGDPVVTSTGGGANLSGAYITSLNTLSQTTNNFLCRGIFQGCYQFQPAAGRVVFSNFYNGAVTGSTGDIKAYIIDSPEQQWIVQASTKGAVTSSMIGLNIGITFNTTTGNTVSGYSNVTVESTSTGSSAALAFRVVDFYSAYAPGGSGPFNNVNFGASATNVVNGLDNANPANVIVVRGNNWDRLNLTARSST